MPSGCTRRKADPSAAVSLPIPRLCCSAPLLSIFGILRLLAAQELALSDCLDACDGVLGCPLNIMDLVS